MLKFVHYYKNKWFNIFVSNLTPSHRATYQWQMTRPFIEINGSNYIKPWNNIAAASPEVAVTIKLLKDE